MQVGEGKATRKSEEITSTPTRASSAEVTPRPTVNERAQAQTKKAKKKGLEEYFGAGARVPPPSLEGTPIDAVGKRRGGAEGAPSGSDMGKGESTALKGNRKDINDKQRESPTTVTRRSKKAPRPADDEHSRRSKKTRSDDEISSPDEAGDGNVANLEAIKGSLWKKGLGTPSTKGPRVTDKKKATFAEAAKKAPLKSSVPAIRHKKCVVAFSVRVDKGKDTQAAFGKKLIAGLSFLQAHIDKHSLFFAIDESDSSRPPIKEKADLPAYQVILRRYFAIPNERAFDNVNQEGGRAIRGSAVMGFSKDPKECLDEAAGDLRHMGCAIYFKQCQEVHTVARQLLLGAPNTIEEEVIFRTIDEELRRIESRLTSEGNAEYKYTSRQLSKWLKYAVVREYPAGMPWEGAEEKKQKQGTNNARLAYVLHVHEKDYDRLAILLAFAKEWKVWQQHWGNTAFTVEVPNEKSSQAERTRYIQMVQTHGSIQLSMGAAMLEGLIDVDTRFSLRLLPDADGNAREPTETSVREILSLMEISGHKAWICLSTGQNGVTTGYFSSVVQEISEHVEAFIACPGAQVYWWLRRRGCLTEDINRLIRHCFTLSQQQKVTASKYLKDLGHAVVERTEGDDIIQASSSEGIYDLTLGLSDKERRSLASRGHNAEAITFGEAKEGSMEAHNFSAALSLTSLRSSKGRGRGTVAPPAPNPTLAQSVYSIGTSRITNESEERSDEEDDDTDNSPENTLVAIDGMDIVMGNQGKGAMLLSTASMEEGADNAEKQGDVDMEENAEVGSQTDSDDPSWNEDSKEDAQLTEKMTKATNHLQLDSEEESSDGSDFGEDDLSVRSNDLDLKLSDFESTADEVSSGEFDANYVKKCASPKTFLHSLWNAAGPSPRAMRICLEIIKEELRGQIAGVPAEFRDLPVQLIDHMYEEAGEDPNDVIQYISQISEEIGKHEDDEAEETSESHVKAMQFDEKEPAPNPPHPGDGGAQEASKTHGPPPGAQQASPAEGTSTEPAKEAGGDKDGVHSMSMAGSE